MRQLCFELGRNHLTFAEIDASNKDLIRLEFFPLTTGANEAKKEEVISILSSHKLLNFDGNISLSYTGHRTTLVPQFIYGDTNAKDIFNLCFSTSNEIIEHKRFFEQQLINVYEIEEWIKRLFVMRFPLINIQHETTHILRGIFNQGSFEPAIHIVPNHDYFSLIAVSKNNLDFFNVFEYTNPTDIIYYIMQVWEKYSDSKKSVAVNWHANKEDDAFLEFKALLEKIKPLSSFTFSFQHKIKHQLLCV